MELRKAQSACWGSKTADRAQDCIISRKNTSGKPNKRQPLDAETPQANGHKGAMWPMACSSIITRQTSIKRQWGTHYDRKQANIGFGFANRFETPSNSAAFQISTAMTTLPTEPNCGIKERIAMSRDNLWKGRLPEHAYQLQPAHFQYLEKKAAFQQAFCRNRHIQKNSPQQRPPDNNQLSCSNDDG